LDGGFELNLRCSGPSAVHFVRARPFAAVLPGNSVAEEVFTTGLSQFLNLYNAALIGRLVLTW
jgi:YggT family protein